MARGINKVILVGNLGNDPDMRYMPSGSAVANVSVATSESWKDKQTGESKDRVEWHNIVFFNRLAEIVGEYLKKGSQVYIEGRLQTDKWQDKQGNDRYTTKIIASEMQMLGGRNTGTENFNQQGSGAPSQQGSGAPSQKGSGAPSQQGSGAANRSATPQPTLDTANSMDDDIPF